MEMSRLGDAYRVLTAKADVRDSVAEALGERRSGGVHGTVAVSQDSAFRNSVWWGGLRLRANLVSTLPVDVFKKSADGIDREQPKPPVLIEPATGVDITEHLYSTQMDKDRYGNAFGIITAQNALGLPAAIELVPASAVTIRLDGRRIKHYRIDNRQYEPREIWHEKQYTLPGLAVGMSPLAYADYTLGGYLSAQEFALRWFATGAKPIGMMRNTKRDNIPTEDRQGIKEAWRAASATGDIFVAGSEWEWSAEQQDAGSAGFLEQQKATDRDVCRYLDVPGSMLDVEITTGNITYANITQANLQFLITGLGPSIIRTERMYSRRVLPQPRFMKLNTDALLRMDPQTRHAILTGQVAAKTRTISEVRALDNLPPYLPEQMAELGTFAQMVQKTTEPTKSPTQKGAETWTVPQ